MDGMADAKDPDAADSSAGYPIGIPPREALFTMTMVNSQFTDTLAQSLQGLLWRKGR